MFNLNMSLYLSFFKHLFAILAVNISRLSFNVGKFRICKLSLFECFPSKIIFTATLCTLSIVVVFSLVRLEC